MLKNATEDVRLEIKFVTYACELDRIEQWINLHPQRFEKHFPDRRIQNIYFDSYKYDAYAENLAGITRRVKVRYRWFGDAPYPDIGTLELKCKQNKFGWKHRYDVKTPPGLPGTSWRRIRSIIAKEIPVEGRIYLEAYPQPVIINQYVRRYYMSRDSDVRVTVDTQMKVYDQRYKSIPNVTRESKIQDLVIIEFKAHPSSINQVNNAVQNFSIRVNRHSKYTTAVAGIYGY